MSEKHSIDNGGVTLALSSIGSGPDLLFVHGLGSAQLLWSALVGELSNSHRCWTLDLRGHGESDRAPSAYNPSAYSSDVAAALDHIGAPTIGIGHSLGGTSLARTASSGHPHLRAIYLLDSRLTPRTSEGAPSGVAALFTKQLAMLQSFQPENRPVEDYLDVLAAAPYPTGETNRDVMVPEQLRGRAESLSMLDPGCIETMLSGSTDGDDMALDTALNIAIPMRVVAADPALGAVFLPEHEQQLRTIAPQATLTTMLGVGHQLLMIEGYDEQVRVDLEAWLAGLEDAA